MKPTRKYTHKKKPGKPKGTRKSRRGNNMTIPELRRAFETIEAHARKRPTIGAFKSHWARLFGKPISDKSAEEYINFMAKKKQRGGMAPVDYDMRPGAFGAPDGVYQTYVSKGFFVPEMSNAANCMKGGAMPNPAAFAASFVGHPYVAQNPPTLMHQANAAFSGVPVGPLGADVTAINPSYMPMGGSGVLASPVTPLSNNGAHL
jgi:hypothetical protein